MTTIYTTYQANTGQIIGHVTTDNDILLDLNLQGQSYITGYYDPADYYVSNAQAVKKPAKPDTANLCYEFDYASGQWQVDQAATALQARIMRNIYLSGVDRINPTWYASLSDAQQQELKTYRQALLDVPQQADFPTRIEWPAKPAWL